MLVHQYKVSENRSILFMSELLHYQGLTIFKDYLNIY